ncbi:hypothetical protein [Streptomyces flaveus]|uniref:Uncharacterized protein n=1 Tax=Streptomyces flaveus TaxID=66370 RepID=A0A917VM80_9ACTN|nr:hypothetical protein [Streptomyces flaveus]GGK98186.1 hypothetical protein GCM10010094_68880 [Streptomyces flaveus]
MVRPAVSEWESVFGFADDPTPGDAEMLGRLASSYRSVADNAGDALPLVSQLENQQVGEGKSMEKLRDKLGDLANHVRKLHSSYDQAASALSTYMKSLSDQQQRADQALADGQDAKDRLASATEVVRAAGADIGRLDAAAPPPDDQEARRNTRRALDEARDSQSSAQGLADDAQADLDAARLLAEDARNVREADAAVAARALDEARDEAVEGKSVWEKIRDKLSLAFGIIGGVLGVLAMLVPGLQGIGLALTIGSFAFSAAAFGINISKSVETGEWDVLDIVLSSVGLILGGAAIVKGVGAIVQAVKVGGIGKIGSGIKDFGREFKLIPEALTKTLPRNIRITVNDIKNIPGKFVDVVKGIGSKLDGIASGVRFGITPNGGFLGSIWKAFGTRSPLQPNLPTVPGLAGGTYRWPLPEVAGFWLGVAGLIYGPAAYADHKAPQVHDSSYLPGTT